MGAIEIASAAAQVAANASAALERASQELAALDEEATTLLDEQQALRSERDAAEQQARDLADAVAAAAAESQRADLAAEIASGTPREADARAAADAARAALAAARQALAAREADCRARQPRIEQRLADIERALDANRAQMEQCRARQTELRDLHARAHAEAGKDEQTRIAREFQALAERRDALTRQMAALDEETAALRAQIVPRLNDWPDLTRETLAAYLDYHPGPWVRMLRCWQELATLAGEESQAIDPMVWQTLIGSTRVPLWHLMTYGPRALWERVPEARRDLPLRQYAQLLRDLAAYLAQQEARECEQQLAARLR